MSDDRTTNLGLLRLGAPFTWGAIIRIVNFGRYSVVIHHPWKVDGSAIVVGSPNLHIVEYHAYVDDKDTSRGFLSIEAAVVGAIAYAYDGPNTQADKYFLRAIGAAKKKDA
jgi:hypothetical protein